MRLRWAYRCRRQRPVPAAAPGGTALRGSAALPRRRQPAASASGRSAAADPPHGERRRCCLFGAGPSAVRSVPLWIPPNQGIGADCRDTAGKKRPAARYSRNTEPACRQPRRKPARRRSPPPAPSPPGSRIGLPHMRRTARSRLPQQSAAAPSTGTRSRSCCTARIQAAGLPLLAEA